MVALAVVDTHALIWYAGQRWQKLGREARRVFEEVDAVTERSSFLFW